MFSKKKGSTPLPAEQAPSAPQLGHQFQSLFAQEINPPLANVDFGFNRTYQEPGASAAPVEPPPQPPSYSPAVEIPDYIPPTATGPAFPPMPEPLSPVEPEPVVWGMNDQTLAQAAMPAPALEEPWQSAPPDMQPVPMTWPTPEPAAPMQDSSPAPPAFDDFLSAPEPMPAPEFPTAAEPLPPAYAMPEFETPPLETMAAAATQELHYSNPVLTPEEAAVMAQPVEPAFWENVASAPMGQQIETTPEATGQFLDSVSEQLYPEDPFTSGLPLDPMALSEGEQAFEEASQFLFPETAGAPLDWDDPNPDAFEVPAYETPALELGPSYQTDAPSEFDDISATLGPDFNAPPEPVAFTDPGSATGAWDFPAPAMPEPSFETNLSTAEPGWEVSLDMPPIPPAAEEPVSSWTPVTEIGTSLDAAEPAWEIGQGPHPYADEFETPDISIPTEPATYTLDMDFGPTTPTTDDWTATTSGFEEEDTGPVYDLSAMAASPAPETWDMPAASPAPAMDISHYSSSLQDLAAAAASMEACAMPVEEAPAQDFNAYLQPAPMPDTFGSMETEDDTPVYSLDEPTASGFEDWTASSSVPMDYGQPMQPAEEAQSTANWDSWATPAPMPQDAFASTPTQTVPQADAADLMNPANWPLDKLEVLQNCQIDQDKYLFLVRNGSLYALMGQAGNPQNPGISIVKVFQGNPLNVDPTFGASRQAGMGDQHMYVAQVGPWSAILSTLRDQIFLHTELS